MCLERGTKILAGDDAWTKHDAHLEVGDDAVERLDDLQRLSARVGPTERDEQASRPSRGRSARPTMDENLLPDQRIAEPAQEERPSLEAVVKALGEDVLIQDDVGIVALGVSIVVDGDEATPGLAQPLLVFRIELVAVDDQPGGALASRPVDGLLDIGGVRVPGGELHGTDARRRQAAPQRRVVAGAEKRRRVSQAATRLREGIAAHEVAHSDAGAGLQPESEGTRARAAPRRRHGVTASPTLVVNVRGSLPAARCSTSSATRALDRASAAQRKRST